MKRCCKCKEIKDLSAFWKNKSRKDGLHQECKICSYSNKIGKRQAASKRYYLKNKEEIAKRDRAYRLANKAKIDTRNLTYQRKRYKENPKYRAIVNARLRISNFLKNKEKYSKSLGCSFDLFCKHIESQFKSRMTWENYGKWHIDHKFPLSVAYEFGPELFKKSCHYSNLQPMWALDNLRKAAKVEQPNLNSSINSLEAKV